MLWGKILWREVMSVMSFVTTDVIPVKQIASSIVTDTDVQRVSKQQPSNKRLKDEYIKSILEARKGVGVKTGLVSDDD